MQSLILFNFVLFCSYYYLLLLLVETDQFTVAGAAFHIMQYLKFKMLHPRHITLTDLISDAFNVHMGLNQ